MLTKSCCCTAVHLVPEEDLHRGREGQDAQGAWSSAKCGTRSERYAIEVRLLRLQVATRSRKGISHCLWIKQWVACMRPTRAAKYMHCIEMLLAAWTEHATHFE
jgi:hypothetical protein